MMIDYVPFRAASITDRAYWNALAKHPLGKQLEQLADQAEALPWVPSATDYLAAKRLNDRNRLDQHWHQTRKKLSLLVVRRAMRGFEADDHDDRLVNWLYGLMYEPSWVVSAHLEPGMKLPVAGQAQLDLAACEMAALLAEAREVLGPWLDDVCPSLGLSIVAEIDRRVLDPLKQGVSPWWARADSTNIINWSGVCAGSVLAACESLAVQGFARPQVRERMIEVLRMFIERAFTPEGECDEGVGYWWYGMGFASLGLSRLKLEELHQRVSPDRLRQVAEYPMRAHLGDDLFFCGNDGGPRLKPDPVCVPWLARVTGSNWLAQWAERADELYLRHLSHVLRGLPWLTERKHQPVQLKATEATTFLADQQVGIFRQPTSAGRLTLALTGGHNGERHNHNDLGHFLVLLDGTFIVPDLGAPHYSADFFGPKRYTYLSASSRGHCCPIVNGCEQAEGVKAAGTVLATEAEPTPRLKLDLTKAYADEAGLKKWTRELKLDAAQHGGLLTDVFETVKPGATISHVIWSAVEPKVSDINTAVLKLGPVQVQLSPTPQALRIEKVDVKPHRLRDYPEGFLYRIEADYVTNDAGICEVVTMLGVP